MGKLLAFASSFFLPGGPLLAALGYIFKPSRMIVWVPLVFLAVSVMSAGLAMKNYIRSAEASKALVIKQGGQIDQLRGEVQLERQSVETATKNIVTYTKAVQVYAAKQQVYQAQITTIRSKLAPTKIIEKAQTDEKGATDDLNRDYADMLSMFDSTTNAAAAASGGTPGNPGQTTVTTTVTRHDTTREVEHPQKRDTGP